MENACCLFKTVVCPPLSPPLSFKNFMFIPDDNFGLVVFRRAQFPMCVTSCCDVCVCDDFEFFIVPAFVVFTSDSKYSFCVIPTYPIF